MSNNLILPRYAESCSAANLDFNDMIQRKMKEGKEVFHLGFGQSPFPVMPLLEENLKKFTGKAEYISSAGLESLRESIAGFHRHFDNIENICGDDVVVGPGSKQLIATVITIFHGEVLIPSPAWTTYKPQCVLAGKVPKVLPLSADNDWKLTPDILNAAFSGHTHSNPGATYSKEEIILLSAAFRKLNIIVIADEIYGRINYKNLHESLAKHYPEGTILSSGLSKGFSAGGWRIGYHIYPKKLELIRKAIIAFSSNTYTCAPVPQQYAAALTMTSFDECENYFNIVRIALSHAAEFTIRVLRGVDVKVSMPGGGYYCLPDFSCLRPFLKNIKTSAQLFRLIAEETGVYIMPASDFMRPETELTGRLCFINFNGAAIMNSVDAQKSFYNENSESFVKKYCPHLNEAINRIAAFVMAAKR